VSELNPRQLDALGRVKREPRLELAFFNNLNGLIWLSPLKEHGFFDPIHNPPQRESQEEGYFHIPVWPALSYLERIAPELQIPSRAEQAEIVLTVIRTVTEDAKSKAFHNFRTWTSFARILRDIPLDLLETTDVVLFTYWLQDPFDRMLVGTELGENFLPRLLKESSSSSQYIAAELLRAFVSLRWEMRRWGTREELEPHLPVDSYHSKSILAKVAKSVGATLHERGLKILREPIQDLIERGEKDAYSTIWRPAVEDHEQNGRGQDVVDTLVDAYRDALLGYVESRAAEALPLIGSLLDGEQTIFRRIAIYTLSEQFVALHPLTHRILDIEFFSHHYLHEMYHFLAKRFKQLSQSDQQLVLICIAHTAKDNVDRDLSPDIQLKQESYEKLRWLSALKDQGFPEIDNMYAESLAATGSEPEHPDFSSYMTSGWVEERSAYTTEELLSRPFDNLLSLLEDFVPSTDWRGPTRWGLSQSLKDAVKTQPTYFSGNLSRLLHLHPDYIYQVIQGFKELWTERQYDNWNELLAFCEKALVVPAPQPAPASSREAARTADQSWIVSAVGEVIRAGTTSDDQAFDEALLPKAREILVAALKIEPGEPFDEEQDAVTAAINSPRGKCIEGLINYALRMCRIAQKRNNEHKTTWNTELQSLFDAQLDLTDTGNYEFATLFANYLPNFLYLDRHWTLQALPRVFDKGNTRKWLSAMQGYCYVNQVYAEIYKFLKNNGDLRKGIETPKLAERGREKLIQNIAVSYMSNEEPLKGKESLVGYLLNRWKLDELRELIWFFWTLRRGESSNFIEKLLALWTEIDRRSDATIELDQRILSCLCKWIVYVESLDAREMSLLSRAVPFADLTHDSYVVVENLKRLVVHFPKEVAELYRRMLSRFAPTYPQEDIEETLEFLLSSELDIRQIGKEICEKYLDYKISFPAELRTRLLKNVED
jgi:hypothetical protein